MVDQMLPFLRKILGMISIVKFLQSLVSPDPVPPELIRAKAYEMWKAQGGGTINPDANWQAAIDQLKLAEKLSRRNFILELIRLIIASLSTSATIFGGSILRNDLRDRSSNWGIKKRQLELVAFMHWRELPMIRLEMAGRLWKFYPLLCGASRALKGKI
jgi:hypothetical protein